MTSMKTFHNSPPPPPLLAGERRAVVQAGRADQYVPIATLAWYTGRQVIHTMTTLWFTMHGGGGGRGGGPTRSV